MFALAASQSPSLVGEETPASAWPPWLVALGVVGAVGLGAYLVNRGDGEATALRMHPMHPNASFPFEEIEGKISARQWLRASHLAEGERALFVPGEAPALIHKDPRRPGKWRVTWFGRDGQPWGHNEPDTYEDALRLVQEDGLSLADARPVRASDF